MAFTYILASRKYGTLYTGVTTDLARRMFEHREGLIPGFTGRYGVTRLVWYEIHALTADAIHREKRIKKWSRAMKIRVIEQMNPAWDDLYETLNM